MRPRANGFHYHSPSVSAGAFALTLYAVMRLSFRAHRNSYGATSRTDRIGNLTPMRHLMQSERQQRLPVRREVLLHALWLPGSPPIQFDIAERIEKLQILPPELHIHCDHLPERWIPLYVVCGSRI